MSLFSRKQKKENKEIVLTETQKKSVEKINRVDNLISFAALLVVSTIMFLNIQVAIIPSCSMYPTLAIKEFVLAHKIDHSRLERGDIVLFHFKTESQSSVFCKRMIALPGDTVSIKDNTLYINGESKDEPYCAEPMLCQDMEEITLGKDEYFVMGDNRNNSADSRVFGPVKGKDFIGHAVFHHRFFDDPELDDFLKNI